MSNWQTFQKLCRTSKRKECSVYTVASYVLIVYSLIQACSESTHGKWVNKYGSLISASYFPVCLMSFHLWWGCSLECVNILVTEIFHACYTLEPFYYSNPMLRIRSVVRLLTLRMHHMHHAGNDTEMKHELHQLTRKLHHTWRRLNWYT